MAEFPLTIIDFIIKMNIFGQEDLSLGHRTFLKSFYGMELDPQELEFYCRATGRTTYIAREEKEVTAIIGRRGGKTRLAALIAVYEAVRHIKPKRGEGAFIVVIAPSLSQAQIAFEYISLYLHASPVLEGLIVEERRSEIELRNGITIRCLPCSHVTVRGISVICAICDELGFWQHEENAANPEREVIAELRPTMATFPNAKLIKISTPFRKEGILYENLQDRDGLQYPVWQVSTREMNPTIPEDVFTEADRENPEHYRREYLAEFTDSLAGWIPRELLDACVIPGRRELPPVRDASYIAVVDPAFRSSDFGFSILCKAGEYVTVLYSTRWTGTREIPLQLETVLRQIKDILSRYGIGAVVGDQFCFPLIKQQFEKFGIFYTEFHFGPHTRASIFGNLRQLISQQRISLIDEPELLRQLRCLEEIRMPNGNIDIRPPGSSKDDVAITVALGAFELTNRPTRPSPFIMPTFGRQYFPYPPTCPIQTICQNFPRCTDEGACQGFVNNGLSG